MRPAGSCASVCATTNSVKTVPGAAGEGAGKQAPAAPLSDDQRSWDVHNSHHDGCNTDEQQATVERAATATGGSQQRETGVDSSRSGDRTGLWLRAARHGDDVGFAPSAGQRR